MSHREQSEIVVFAGHTRLMIVCVALAFLLPAVAGFFTNHKARQSWEKRELAVLPNVIEAKSSKHFFTDLEAFIDDHIGFATPLNKIYRQLQFYVFSDSPIANVDVGDDGFVFFNAHSATRPYAAIKKICRPSTPHIKKTERAMAAFASAVREYGASISYAIVPSKPLLYPQELPATVPAPHRKACLALDPLQSAAGQLRERASGKDYAVHFPVEELLSMRNEPAFYPPGNFHSASKINHVFAAGLLRSLDIDPGTAYSKGARLQMINADMRVMGFVRSVQAWTYPYADFRVSVNRGKPEWVTRYYSRARDFGTYVSARPASNRSALLLSNSFGAFVAPHLAPGFKSLTHINLNALQESEAALFLQQIMERVKPDDLIVLFHDGGIPSAPLYMLANAAL
ncbi:hypothetical protein R0135_08460 [Congregibacter variabilis]|uniref:AlgX/AlgJ SGNH hydrolase-like domain-containing protein n=1 Tax=Congregibacter variabilis TaxID=3081200 RepID=A0ABZ0I812_9GAMM|nr:hypothetical protein R0135_08460 [Congregibacter sp. IMCC43200]